MVYERIHLPPICRQLLAMSTQRRQAETRRARNADHGTDEPDSFAKKRDPVAVTRSRNQNDASLASSTVTVSLWPSMDTLAAVNRAFMLLR